MQNATDGAWLVGELQQRRRASKVQVRDWAKNSFFLRERENTKARLRIAPIEDFIERGYRDMCIYLHPAHAQVAPEDTSTYST